MAEYIYDVETIEELLREEKAKPLEDEAQLEDVLVAIDEASAEIEFLKHLKKRRTDQIANEISKQDGKVSRLREIIQQTLRASKVKSRKIPGIGKVSRSDRSGTWEIEDEEKLIQELSKRGELDNVANKQYKFDRKALNELFDLWSQTEELPEFVIKGESSEVLTVSFDKEFKDGDVKSSSVTPVKNSSIEAIEIDEKDYDKLEF